MISNLLIGYFIINIILTIYMFWVETPSEEDAKQLAYYKRVMSSQQWFILNLMAFIISLLTATLMWAYKSFKGEL